MKYYTGKKKARPSKPPAPITIGDFPLEILRQIVWFLPLVDAARTSIFSRQWRYLWLSNPNWVLTPLTIQCGQNNWRKFEKVVNDVIFLHNGSGIEKIRIGNANLNGALTRSTRMWMDHLTTHHPITELEIDIGLPSAPPYSLYYCKSLIYLRLAWMHMNIPDNVELPRLKKISLFFVTFSNSREFQTLMNGCKALEIMELINIGYTDQTGLDMKIDSGVLNVFKFICEFEFAYVHLSAERLETLEFRGKHLIVPSGFVFSEVKEVRSLKPEQCIRLYLNQKRENRIHHYGKKMNNTLHALSKATTLSLGEWCTEYLTTIADIFKLPVFPNLKKLEVDLWPNKDHANIILYLVRCMPILEYLKLRTCENTCDDIYLDEQRDGYPLQPDASEEICVNLTHIEMRLFRGTNAELKLTETFLGCCPDLKIFDIKFAQRVKQHVKQRIRNNTPKLPRLSDKVELTIGNYTLG